MTRKEQLRMDNLILENIRLKDALNKHFRVYSDTLSENVCLKARIDTLRDVIAWDIGAEYTEEVK